MGVDRSDVIVVGVDIGYEKFNSDWYEDDEAEYDIYRFKRKSEIGDIIYIDDGMSGRYFVVGELLVNDYDGYSGLGLFVHNEESEDYKATQQRVKEFVKNKFGLDVNPKYITLTHWS